MLIFLPCSLNRLILTRQTTSFQSESRTCLNFLYLSCFFLILSSRGWSIWSSTSGWYLSVRKAMWACLANFFLFTLVEEFSTSGSSWTLISSLACWSSLEGTILDLSFFLCFDFCLNLTHFRDILITSKVHLSAEGVRCELRSSRNFDANSSAHAQFSAPQSDRITVICSRFYKPDVICLDWFKYNFYFSSWYPVSVKLRYDLLPDCLI